MEELRDSIARVVAIDPTNLTLHQMADMLVKLTALYGTVTEVVTHTALDYKQVFAAHYLKEGAASRAKIGAETTQEYRDMVEAKRLESVLLEHIRTIKLALRVKDADRRNY